MAEGKPRRPEPGAQLEELNDQLARFLQHADQLLEDWARFGAQVRTTVDQEVGRIEQAAAEAGERATKQLAGQVDRLATSRVSARSRQVAAGSTSIAASSAPVSASPSATVSASPT